MTWSEAASNMQDWHSLAPYIWDICKPEILGAVGGLILFGWNVVRHWKLPPPEKHKTSRYMQWFLFQFIVLPALGAFIVWVDTTGGSVVGPLLALQIGLTGPKVLESIIVGAANRSVDTPTPVTAD